MDTTLVGGSQFAFQVEPDEPQLAKCYDSLDGLKAHDSTKGDSLLLQVFPFDK